MWNKLEYSTSHSVIWYALGSNVKNELHIYVPVADW
jgi:hypothetical protein